LPFHKFKQIAEGDGIVTPLEVMYRKRPAKPSRRAASIVLITPWYSVALTIGSRTGKPLRQPAVKTM
jgi:hypothetical protein